MRMSLKSSFPAVASQITELGRRGPIVAAIALTRTGKDVQDAIKAEMRSVFDRPTTYAVNGTFLKSANRSDLQYAS